MDRIFIRIRYGCPCSDGHGYLVASAFGPVDGREPFYDEGGPVLIYPRRHSLGISWFVGPGLDVSDFQLVWTWRFEHMGGGLDYPHILGCVEDFIG